jgi:hypothetical protein
VVVKYSRLWWSERTVMGKAAPSSYGPKSSKTSDNGEQLFIIDLVVTLSLGVFSGHKGNGVEDSCIILLG